MPRSIKNEVPVVRRIPIPIKRNQHKGQNVYNYSIVDLRQDSSTSEEKSVERPYYGEGFYTTNGEKYDGETQTKHGYAAFGSSADSGFDASRIS